MVRFGTIIKIAKDHALIRESGPRGDVYLVFSSAFRKASNLELHAEVKFKRDLDYRTFVASSVSRCQPEV